MDETRRALLKAAAALPVAMHIQILHKMPNFAG